MFQKYGKKALMVVAVLALVGGTVLPSLIAAATGVTLNFDGSTTVYPIVQESQAQFPIVPADNGTNMVVNQDSSGVGRQELLDNDQSVNGYPIDIADASSACGSSDYVTTYGSLAYSCPGDSTGTGRPQLVQTSVAKDAITVIVNKNFIMSTCSGVPTITAGSITYPTMTLEQLQGIYEGQITDWHTLYSGCPSTVIVPRDRVTTSGTHQSFLKLGKIYCNPAVDSDTNDTGNCSTTAQSYWPSAVSENVVISNTGLPRLNGNPDMEGAIDNNTGAPTGSQEIGFIGLAFTDANNVQFAIDASNGGAGGGTGGVVPPDQATALSGSYAMSRTLYMYSAPTSSNPKQVIQDYLNWIIGPEGQADVNDQGFVPLFTAAPAWDVNLNHSADLADLISIGGHWGQNGPATGNPEKPILGGWIRQDVNLDGTINVLDLVTVGNHWGQTW
ncbi:MAG: substrate-binding domain-containing protein [Anaerolineales bacterium]